MERFFGRQGGKRVEFNKLIPELTVRDIERTREFYVDVLGFELEYERQEDKFMFLSLEGSQIMFEEMHEDGWNFAEMVYPLGRGINLSIEIEDIETLYRKIIYFQYPLYRPLLTSKYESNGEDIEQKEFLIQDPDGYLLRFTQEE